ncbi:MAG: prepilin-type N-terminal cleavage/methylation domain-containing protein [Dictyoglomi bacterium]|nr:prepilin-type N-terminal cleavage/methylation domain-containing protein [Dictyoglomota bacterium]HHV80603.1 prepilin-type N-terminal cleavage/methylation domain-containing protein [bacterium]
MGFSLIELLVVVSLLGVLIPTGTNSFIGLIEYNHLCTAALTLAKNIRMCQYISMEEGITTRILLDIKENKYHLVKVEKVPVLYKTFLLEGGVSLSWTNFKKYKIEFDPVGCPDMSDVGTPDRGGTIALKSKSNKFLYVIITPVTGYVRISEEPP